jgi:hypothetical protein
MEWRVKDTGYVQDIEGKRRRKRRGDDRWKASDRR